MTTCISVIGTSRISAACAAQRTASADSGEPSTATRIPCFLADSDISHPLDSVMVDETLQPFVQLGQVSHVGANGLPMKPAELLVDVALPHGVAVAVPQQNEAGREGQLRSDQLAHVRALASRFL